MGRRVLRDRWDQQEPEVLEGSKEQMGRRVLRDRWDQQAPEGR